MLATGDDDMHLTPVGGRLVLSQVRDAVKHTIWRTPIASNTTMWEDVKFAKTEPLRAFWTGSRNRR